MQERDAAGIRRIDAATGLTSAKQAPNNCGCTQAGDNESLCVCVVSGRLWPACCKLVTLPLPSNYLCMLDPRRF